MLNMYAKKNNYSLFITLVYLLLLAHAKLILNSHYLVHLDLDLSL